MTTENRDPPQREERLGFGVDEPTKALIEPTPQTIVPDETLVLSERDQAVFFDALVEPPPCTHHDIREANFSVGFWDRVALGEQPKPPCASSPWGGHAPPGVDRG